MTGVMTGMGKLHAFCPERVIAGTLPCPAL